MTMPQLPFKEIIAKPDSRSASPDHTLRDRDNVFGSTWDKMSNWLKKEAQNEEAVTEESERLSEKMPCQESAPVRPTHAVIPGMPRPITFKRQDSERREKLYAHELGHEERRATSTDRRLGTSCARKPSPMAISENTSLPPIAQAFQEDLATSSVEQTNVSSTNVTVNKGDSDRHGDECEVNSRYEWTYSDMPHPNQLSDALDEVEFQREAEAKWILNLSMHFRDNSDREKFFVTYAEEPNKWRRVTVSCDYRYADSDSLESELKSLHYQRDKSERIYEAIWDSLPRIQFYPTVTNLKLETSDGRLHVHVTEDLNEIVRYPSVSAVSYLDVPRVLERLVEFDGHMSGYVYKVKVNGRLYIKKEIPGPEAVDEFLYEMNALNSLRGSPGVVQLEGLIVDDRNERVKGLLLQYCEKGALVDLIYDWRNSEFMSWDNRERWTRQIIGGLADIHEAGYVQGDFTLSNIVLNRDDDATIIDINRRGCPIGWDPPELSELIEAGQRISMHIGVKSDLYQLGMVLWALAEQEDEPERQPGPLQFSPANPVPQWYQDIVEACLSADPRKRWPARVLLTKFPAAQTSSTDSPVLQRQGALLPMETADSGVVAACTLPTDVFSPETHKTNEDIPLELEKLSVNQIDMPLAAEASTEKSPVISGNTQSGSTDKGPSPTLSSNNANTHKEDQFSSLVNESPSQEQELKPSELTEQKDRPSLNYEHNPSAVISEDLSPSPVENVNVTSALSSWHRVANSQNSQSNAEEVQVQPRLIANQTLSTKDGQITPGEDSGSAPTTTSVNTESKSSGTIAESSDPHSDRIEYAHTFEVDPSEEHMEGDALPAKSEFRLRDLIEDKSMATPLGSSAKAVG